MNKCLNNNEEHASENEASADETKTRTKARGKKRKRKDSESSTDIDDILPENTLEVEKSLQASAIKNNLDDISVKKILKKVVTNDHVLALVKLREEEEESRAEENTLQPKLTRAKAKELMKVSAKSAPWNLELTPIKHIPVKTRPEVTALIAQELPDDEDDDEYEPTHDDVPSDDDQTLESCSDLDSQPRTPATPRSQHTTSPRVVQDGPFKVPQELTPVRKKLVLEEEATIARRTRSKLSLSSTPIEHIESSFVPPDDILPVVDDLWSQFLEECLNPTSVSRHEDDDDADPEYNVAADPDAHDEDEEALESSIIKISKKELNDLVTELFSIMPEPTSEELSMNLPDNVVADQTEIPSQWDGKQESKADDETGNKVERITPEKTDSCTRRVSIGKSESDDPEQIDTTKAVPEKDKSDKQTKTKKKPEVRIINKIRPAGRKKPTSVKITVEEHNLSMEPPPAHPPPPPLLRRIQRPRVNRLEIHIDQAVCVLPEQRLILEQQLRQHIQLAASNFLQLYVNPAHWSLAPTYKGYLEQFQKMLDSNPDSVVNVCNLKPALELIDSWEKSVSEETPENKKMVEFIQKEIDRHRKRRTQHCLYIGDFPETFMKVVANSNVFLYPYLLPSMPYSAENPKKFKYRRCEDSIPWIHRTSVGSIALQRKEREALPRTCDPGQAWRTSHFRLIALGLDEFWSYVEANPQIFKPRSQPNPRHRWGLTTTIQLICRHMLPWLSPQGVAGHIKTARKEKENPIYEFFEMRKVTPVKHKLLPFNPKMTLYEQPEHEMPRIWLRYIARSSKRCRDFLYRRKNSGIQPKGVTVDLGSAVAPPLKKPLPIDFTKTIISQNANVLPKIAPAPLADKFDLQINTCNIVSNLIPVNIQPANNATNVIQTGNTQIASRPELTNKSEMSTTNIVANIVTPPSVIVTANSATNYGIANSAINYGIANSATNYGIANSAINYGIANSATNYGNMYSSTTSSTLPGNNNSTGVTKIAQNPLLNMFQVIKTSTGAYLVPLTMVQTANSVDIPTTTKDTTVVANNLPEDSSATSMKDKRNEDMNHCKCCLLLKKICKRKQTYITDFFKLKNSEERKCDCSHRRYPKISKRLRLLVNNYKNKSSLVHRELQKRLDIAKKDNSVEESEMDSDSSCSLEDMAYVTSYQLKLTIRAGIIRNSQTKKQVNNLFSKFKPDTDDPRLLTERLYKAFHVDLVDLYKEFLGFLTAKQADEIDKFKDYFLQTCAADLVKKIEEEVKDKEIKCKMLSQLSKILADSVSTACEICTSLLATMQAHPRLAEYVFRLFPHRAIDRHRIENIQVRPLQTQNTQALLESTVPQTRSTEPPIESTEPRVASTEPSSVTTQTLVQEQDEGHSDVEQADDDALTICDDQTLNTMDYEADHSSSGEDDCAAERSMITEADCNSIKCEESANQNVLDTPELTISKTEVQEYCESTDMSTIVMSEDEPVKSEPLEWKRDEDKFILELLLQHITPEQRREKTILDIINEKNLPLIIAEKFTDKSITDIRERVMYLLNILVLSDY